MPATDTRPKIAVIGELNVDLIATGLRRAPVLGQEILAEDFQIVLGSASAIFACGVAKLGHPVTFISKVGADDFGRFCLAALRDLGVSTKLVEKDPEIKTGVTVSLSTRQDRAMVTYLGAIAELEYRQLPLVALRQHAHLHLTSYFLQQGLRPAFPKILRQARQWGLTTSFDPNSDPAQQWRREIWRVFAQTDVLFLNKTEAAQLTGRPDVRQALALLGQSVPCVVIKLGPRGAIAIKGGQITQARGFKVAALDTTGAGDSFAAGFVSAYVAGLGLRECLEQANVCGALSTQRAGGTAGQPTRAEVARFLRSKADRG